MINSGMNVMLIATKVLMDIFLSQFLKFSEIWTSRSVPAQNFNARKKASRNLNLTKSAA